MIAHILLNAFHQDYPQALKDLAKRHIDNTTGDHALGGQMNTTETERLAKANIGAESWLTSQPWFGIVIWYREATNPLHADVQAWLNTSDG